MKTRRSVKPLLITLAFLLAPTTLFAQNSIVDDEGRTAYADNSEQTEQTEQAEQSVTMEDMLADDEALMQREEVEVEVREEGEREVVRERQRTPPHWTWIIGRNALAGGVTGGLIGLGIWLVTDRDWDPWFIAQFAGGGILVGTAIGVVELLVRSEPYAAEKPASLQWMERDMPETFEVRIFKVDF